MARFAFILLIALLACGDREHSSTINYFFTYDPRSLDPALSTDVPTGEVVALLFDNVTQFDVDGVLQPGLARSWDVDSAGDRYTFHLRSDARFHDGRAVTASDVRNSWLRTLRAGGRIWPLLPIRGARAYAASESEEVEGIEVPNDTTVIVTLQEPLNVFPKFLAMPSTAIVPTPVPEGFDQKPVGSGPWRFVSWSHDDAILLARNQDYWGKVPESDTLRIRIIPEPLTQAAEYEAGNLSVVEIPFGETRRWEEQHADELQRRPALRVLYIAINTTRGPLQDVRVRQALNYAIDAETILETVIGGRGVLSAGAIPPGLVGYDSTRAPYPHDPERAKQLLREAGYSNGLVLQLWRTQRAELARVAQAVQQQLARVGVVVEIIERDASSARAASTKGEADLFLTDWYADYPDPETFQYATFHSRNRGTGGNRAFYSNPVTDSLIVLARTTTSEEYKAELSEQIDELIFEAAPWIFLWFPVDVWAQRPEVEGWRIPAIFNGQRWVDVKYSP
ncbi:MAG: ABC transporter substrate-binding protein [Gemmatimonadales bacterium]